MIGFTHAFWNAVVVKRGGSQSDGLQRRVDEHDPEAEAEMHDRLGLRLVQGAHGLVDVLRRLSDRRLRDDPNTLAATRTSQVLQIALADQALLDQDADLGEATLGDQVGQEDRLVGHRALGEGERPLTQPVVGSGDADRRHLEALLDRLAHRHAVVGDVGAEHHQAALVDEFAVGVDHRLDRTLGQTLDLAVDHLHRPIHQALLDRLFEDEVEATG